MGRRAGQLGQGPHVPRDSPRKASRCPSKGGAPVPDLVKSTHGRGGIRQKGHQDTRAQEAGREGSSRGKSWWAREGRHGAIRQQRSEIWRDRSDQPGERPRPRDRKRSW
eukprot:7450585-Pyramimonas_sp.AAC.1